MQIHPDLYRELKKIDEAISSEIDRFYSKIKLIEKTNSTLGAISPKKITFNRKKDLDSLIIELLEKIEKTKYLQDFLILSKDGNSLSYFYMDQILTVSDMYKKSILKAPHGYISKKVLFSLIVFFLLPFVETYKKEVLRKDINRCKVSIESESSQNFAWCDILIQAKSGTFKKMLPKQIKEEIEKIIRLNNPKQESVISSRKVDKYYQNVVWYISNRCYVSMEYDRRNGIPETEIQDYFNKKFPFSRIIFERCLHKHPISKEELEESVSSEEFYRTTECDDDAEYVYGGVFIPKKKPE